MRRFPERSCSSTSPSPAGTLVRARRRTRLSSAQVNSYFLTLDPNGKKARNLTREGTVVFPEPILGLCVRAACLETLNETLGPPGTRYQPKNSHHGTDIGEDSDYLVVEDDRRTLRVSLGAGQYIDQLRVVTGRP